MSQVCLISGSPGCGKTNWILNTFKNYSANCGYLRLGGYSEINLEQAINSKIDFAFLSPQHLKQGRYFDLVMKGKCLC